MCLLNHCSFHYPWDVFPFLIEYPSPKESTSNLLDKRKAILNKGRLSITIKMSSIMENRPLLGTTFLFKIVFHLATSLPLMMCNHKLFRE